MPRERNLEAFLENLSSYTAARWKLRVRNTRAVTLSGKPAWSAILYVMTAKSKKFERHASSRATTKAQAVFMALASALSSTIEALDPIPCSECGEPSAGKRPTDNAHVCWECLKREKK